MNYFFKNKINNMNNFLLEIDDINILLDISNDNNDYIKKLGDNWASKYDLYIKILSEKKAFNFKYLYRLLTYIINSINLILNHSIEIDTKNKFIAKNIDIIDVSWLCSQAILRQIDGESLNELYYENYFYEHIKQTPLLQVNN